MKTGSAEWVREMAKALQPRAVQRSIHDAHGEDCFDAAEGEAMPRICDIAHIIEAQDVGGERAQAGEDAGIAADAAGVLGEAAVADVVGAILDAPVVADGFGAGGGWQNDVADKQGGLTGSAAKSGCGGQVDVPIDADDRADMASPLGVGQAVARREHLDQTGLVARTAVLVGSARAIEWDGWALHSAATA